MVLSPIKNLRREESKLFSNNKFRESLILWKQKQFEWKSLISTNEKDVANDFYNSIIWFKNGAPSIPKRKACAIFKLAPLTMQK